MFSDFVKTDVDRSDFKYEKVLVAKIPMLDGWEWTRLFGQDFSAVRTILLRTKTRS